MEQITLDPESFERVGLIPNQPLGDRGGVDIEGRQVGSTPPLARWDEARQASPHRIVLAGKAPNRFAAQPRVLIQGIERHIVGLDQRRDGAITDPVFAVSCRKPDQRYHGRDRLSGRAIAPESVTAHTCTLKEGSHDARNRKVSLLPSSGWMKPKPFWLLNHVFVHITAVERAGMRRLNEGQKVSFDVVTERGKSAAANLRTA
jgi:hypothetical protein